MRRRVLNSLEELIESGEPNPLLHRVDGLCSARAWDDLVALADRCRVETERGKQLWPIAEHIEYRLALEAPGAIAASVLGPEAGRFALGPLTEVVASTHRFEELEPHLSVPQILGALAAERVIRGEDLTDHAGAHPEVMELPLMLMNWEPEYPLPVYRSDKATFPDAPLVQTKRVRLGDPGDERHLSDPDLERAMLDLVAPWVTQSNGDVVFHIVEGSVESAIDGRWLMRIDSSEALAHMAWAAASGGAYGRRRGGAYGRFAAWWSASELTGLAWPPVPDELHEAMDEVHWYLWEPEDLKPGWNLHLAVHDPVDGWTASVSAHDHL
ncbi:MAG: DUF6183 family protein [Actinomycetota bacterium]